MRNPFTDIAAANVDAIVARYAVANDYNTAAYKNLYSEWKNRAPLLAASTPPMDPEPEPGAPSIFTVDVLKALAQFNAWETAVDLGTIKGNSEPDYTPAITKTKYALPKAPGPIVLLQPARPLGVKIGRGKFAPAPGDVLPVDSTWEDPQTDVVWVKVSEEYFGGLITVYWHVQPSA